VSAWSPRITPGSGWTRSTRSGSKLFPRSGFDLVVVKVARELETAGRRHGVPTTDRERKKKKKEERKPDGPGNLILRIPSRKTRRGGSSAGWTVVGRRRWRPSASQNVRLHRRSTPLRPSGPLTGRSDSWRMGSIKISAAASRAARGAPGATIRNRGRWSGVSRAEKQAAVSGQPQEWDAGRLGRGRWARMVRARRPWSARKGDCCFWTKAVSARARRILSKKIS